MQHLCTSPQVVANNRLTVRLNPLDAILTKNRGGVPIMVNQVFETSHLPSSPAPCLCVSVAAPSSILRTHFQVPYPATPLFATLTETAGVCTHNSQFGSYPSRLETQKERIGRGKPRPYTYRGCPFERSAKI